MGGAIQVSEERGVRYLHFGSHWVQGAMRMSRPYALELEYTREMMLPLLLRPDAHWPARALLIGLGAGSLLKFLWRHRPHCAITVVETVGNNGFTDSFSAIKRHNKDKIIPSDVSRKPPSRFLDRIRHYACDHTQHFIAAAETTVEGAEGLGVVTGDYNDAAKGREAATTMVGNGADVIWHAADVTGLDAIEGAVPSGANVLGCYSDQTELAPPQMGSSLVMDLGNMAVKLGHDVRDGTFAGGTEWKPSVSEMWHWSYDNGASDHNPAVGRR